MDITVRIENGKMKVLYQGDVIIPEVPYGDMAMVGRLCCLSERQLKWMSKEKIFYKCGTFELRMVLQELLKGIEHDDPPTIEKAETYFNFGYPDVCWFITELLNFGKAEQISIIKNMLHMTDTDKESQAYLQKWHYFNRYGMEMRDDDGYGT